MNIPTWLKIWLKGATAAFIGGVANAVAQAMDDPAPFGSWRKTLADVITGGALAVGFYFKKSPFPAQPNQPNTEKQS